MHPDSPPLKVHDSSVCLHLHLNKSNHYFFQPTLPRVTPRDGNWQVHYNNYYKDLTDDKDSNDKNMALSSIMILHTFKVSKDNTTCYKNTDWIHLFPRLMLTGCLGQTPPSPSSKPSLGILLPQFSHCIPVATIYITEVWQYQHNLSRKFYEAFSYLFCWNIFMSSLSYLRFWYPT